MPEVHSLDHFALHVPDLAEAAGFYEDFGLETRTRGDAFDLHTAGGTHRWGRFFAGPAKRLAYVAFGIYADDRDAFVRHLRERNVETLAPPPFALDDESIWFRDDDAHLIELRVADKVSPNAKHSTPNVISPAGVAGAPLRSEAARARPRRLSHVLLFSSDVSRSIAFYTLVLGLRLSDRSGDVVAFLHGRHGSDHHLIAFAGSDAGGFHHCSWDVASIDDIGNGAARMAERGFARGWGFGRHVLGSNYFHYVRDPWGSYSEYSYDIDFIPADGRWSASDVAPENGFFLWGPPPPDDFARNFESPSAG